MSTTQTSMTSRPLGTTKWDRLEARWSRVREFLHGLRIAWVSTASITIGFLFYLKATQAQDLFLEVKGQWQSDTAYWISFYLALVLAWALPVFVSARWILARFEEGRHAHPNVSPVATWVRRRVSIGVEL